MTGGRRTHILEVNEGAYDWSIPEKFDFQGSLQTEDLFCTGAARAGARSVLSDLVFQLVLCPLE